MALPLPRAESVRWRWASALESSIAGSSEQLGQPFYTDCGTAVPSRSAAEFTMCQSGSLLARRIFFIPLTETMTMFPWYAAVRFNLHFRAVIGAAVLLLLGLQVVSGQSDSAVWPTSAGWAVANAGKSRLARSSFGTSRSVMR